MATLISEDEDSLGNLSNNSDFIQEQIDKMDKFETTKNKGLKSKNKKKKSMKEKENNKIESKIEVNPDKIKNNIIENKNKEEEENENNNKNKCCDCIIF